MTRSMLVFALSLALACVVQAGLVGAAKASPPEVAPPTSPTGARPIHEVVADLARGVRHVKAPVTPRESVPGGAPAAHGSGKHVPSGKTYASEASRAVPKPDVHRSMRMRGHETALRPSYGAMLSARERLATIGGKKAAASRGGGKVLRARGDRAIGERRSGNKAYGNPYKAKPIPRR